MRLASLLIAVTLGPAVVASQQIPKLDGRPFVVHLPDAVSASTCVVDAYQTGAFGGYSGGPEQMTIDHHNLIIPTSAAARALKAVVLCRGFAVGLVDVASLDPSRYETAVALQPLAPLRVTGRVAPDGDVTLAGLEMHITFDAAWTCGFFGLADCLIPRFPVATARIERNGTFSFELPDVLGDPVAKKYQMVGGFAMAVEEPPPSYRRYRLEPAGGRTLLPAAAYPDPIVLTIKP